MNQPASLLLCALFFLMAAYAVVNGLLLLHFTREKAVLLRARAGGNVLCGIGLVMFPYQPVEAGVVLAVAALFLLVHPAESKEKAA